MTKLIAIFLIVVVVYCAYHLIRYMQSVKDQEATARQQAATLATQGDTLPGLPPQLAESLRVAQQRGPAALREWLRLYGPAVEDPRKAWIELDFCVAIARDDPSEARRIFKSVKDRTSPASPVWPRVKQLEQAYE